VAALLPLTPEHHGQKHEHQDHHHAGHVGTTVSSTTNPPPKISRSRWPSAISPRMSLLVSRFKSLAAPGMRCEGIIARNVRDFRGSEHEPFRGRAQVYGACPRRGYESVERALLQGTLPSRERV
jgi:hypothetical protein